MDNSFLHINEFYLITFVSTSNALKAESILKKQLFDFILIPTLREISSSCGLAVKVKPSDMEKCRQILVDNHVKAEKYYHVLKEGKKHLIKELTFNP